MGAGGVPELLELGDGNLLRNVGRVLWKVCKGNIVKHTSD
jgi:hypothetical protein